MKCPVDEATLVMSERQGVEVDYCPQCRGVWLDRGELDKILERAANELGPPRDFERERRRDYDDDDDRKREYRDREYQDRGYGDRYKGKRKKSFLSDIFEMGGD